MSAGDPPPHAPAATTRPAPAARGEVPFLMPAGMPPGLDYIHEERPPEGVYYFRLWAGFSCFWYGALALMGMALMFKPLFSPSPGSSGADWGSFVAGGFYGVIGIVFFVPTVIALFGGRRPWVHTLGTVIIAFNMMQLCCVPVLIPLLVTWMKPETKRWYGG